MDSVSFLVRMAKEQRRAARQFKFCELMRGYHIGSSSAYMMSARYLKRMGVK